MLHVVADDAFPIVPPKVYGYPQRRVTEHLLLVNDLVAENGLVCGSFRQKDIARKRKPFALPSRGV